MRQAINQDHISSLHFKFNFGKSTLSQDGSSYKLPGDTDVFNLI